MLKRVSWYVAATLVVLVPAALGLSGNASFSETIPREQDLLKLVAQFWRTSRSAGL